LGYLKVASVEQIGIEQLHYLDSDQNSIYHDNVRKENYILLFLAAKLQQSNETNAIAFEKTAEICA